jgi:hypothetical protein
MYQVIDKRKQELDYILKGKHNVVTKIQAKPSLAESGTTRVVLGEPTRNSCLRFFAVNPLSSNAPKCALLYSFTLSNTRRFYSSGGNFAL